MKTIILKLFILIFYFDATIGITAVFSQSNEAFWLSGVLAGLTGMFFMIDKNKMNINIA